MCNFTEDTKQEKLRLYGKLKQYLMFQHILKHCRHENWGDKNELTN